MKEPDLKSLGKLYRLELLEQIIPFWEKNSLDRKYGGYFTCLDPKGEVYDTDKFIWLQARQVWIFSRLYTEVSDIALWKEIAFLGGNFLEKYGMDTQGNWYFSLNRKGEPLVQPYNIFSDCFAAMAFGKLYNLSNDEKHATMALNTFRNILNRQDNPKRQYNKLVSGTRDLQNFALPMILCNLAMELEPLLGHEQVSEITEGTTDLILNKFYDDATGLVMENVSSTGEFVDSFEGRLLNPGHAIEAMWFIMNLGLRKGDLSLVAKAEEIIYRQLEYGWDKEFGGIFYFMDCKGHPPQQLEWDQKLWWVHLEAMIALAKSYSWNQSEKAKNWLIKIHDYCWDHFRDPENGGEWYGYLNRRGEVLLKLKGGKWKGCFHVPRALLEISNTLTKISLDEN